MTSNYKLINHLIEETGIPQEPAEMVAETVLNYIVRNLPDETTQAQVHQVAKALETPNHLQQLFDAFEPPITANDSDVVATLLDNGLDLNIRLNDGATLLHAAVLCNRANMVELLLIRGADPALHDKEQETPLQCLAYIDPPNPRIAELLLAAGSPPDLYVACLLGDRHQVQMLLETSPQALHTRSGDLKETPLHKAVTEGDKEIVEMLLSAGADVKAHAHGNATPLHWGACRSSIEIAELLLAAGADINAQTNIGHTPVDLGLRMGTANTPVIELLLQHGGQRRVQSRVIPWDTFTSQLQHYYQEVHNSRVEVVFSEKGDCLRTYNIYPIDECYHLSKINPGRRSCFQDEALAELKAVFFPNEHVRIQLIRQNDLDGPVKLEVEMVH